MKKMKISKTLIVFLFMFLFMSFGWVHTVHAATANQSLLPTTNDPSGLVDIKLGSSGDMTSSVKIFLMMTVLTLAPSFLIMFTCFTQVVIVLGLTRQGLGTMTLPPNQVMMGLALFITIYIMSPVISDIDKNAYEPYNKGKITFMQAVDKAEVPLKKFMVENTYDNDLKTFLTLRKDPKPKNVNDVSIWAAVPAYTLSQITKGLFTGLMIYVAFSIVDIIVGSILMFMGMMMIPPQMLSLPLKLLIFVYIGGFSQIIDILFKSIKV